MRLISVPAFVIAGIFVLYLAGCGFAHDEKIVGPYRLIAIDVPEQMSVCYAIDEGTCVGRIPQTVFSIGWNDRFIVAKQRSPSNKALTNYFILEIARDSKLADPSVSVTGPLTAAAFEERVASLGLPPFTKTIKALEN